MNKKIFIIIFLAIVFSPIVLSFSSDFFNVKLDVNLKGYFDIQEKPKFNFENFNSKQYQDNLTNYINESILPRGVMIKNYSTLQYTLFNLGNRPIGIDKNIFEEDYINEELVINGRKDFSIKENQLELENYVNKLELLQDKLAKHNKWLYIYIAPSKANFNLEFILPKYKNLSNKDAINSASYYENLLNKSNLHFHFCRNMKNELEYPAFYSTGIHWSRTFEQYNTSFIIKKLSNLTNKKYRNLLLNEIIVSNTPFWRDSDVYNLQNVWFKPSNIKYYEYSTSFETLTNYDKLNILVQGDSFSDGLRYDLLGNKENNVYYINRDNYIIDLNDNIEYIEQQRNSLDILNYLNKIDVVLLEATEPEIYSYQYGFVDYLLSCLDEYND